MGLIVFEELSHSAYLRKADEDDVESGYLDSDAKVGDCIMDIHYKEFAEGISRVVCASCGEDVDISGVNFNLWNQ